MENTTECNVGIKSSFWKLNYHILNIAVDNKFPAPFGMLVIRHLQNEKE